MNKQLYLENKVIRIPADKQLSIDKIIEVKQNVLSTLDELVDSDYNGYNGAEYYESGKSKLENYIDSILKSGLEKDYCIEKCIKDKTIIRNNVIEYIKQCLLDCYSNKDYYPEVEIKITNLGLDIEELTCINIIVTFRIKE